MPITYHYQDIWIIFFRTSIILSHDIPMLMIYYWEYRNKIILLIIFCIFFSRYFIWRLCTVIGVKVLQSYNHLMNIVLIESVLNYKMRDQRLYRPVQLVFVIDDMRIAIYQKNFLLLCDSYKLCVFLRKNCRLLSLSSYEQSHILWPIDHVHI